ncbi:MAG: NusA-like transcription termination signal-binding factor [Candidatus Woesearchaeota archaeon]|nr:MAG: NusA-like transcription termination signal-binding factor [Candidatus Woesearchaeota archaeon]
MVKKLNIQTIGLMNIFNSLTGVTAKDCFFDEEKLVFIVNEGDLGKVLGKKGANIQRIQNTLKRDIKVIEYSEDVIKFVKNLIYPAEVQKVYKEGTFVVIEPENNKIKGQIYGRERKNLEKINEILKKYSNTEVKIK